MTCIAFDGKTMAADKRAVNCGLARTITKVHRVNDCIVGFAGDASVGMMMLEWVAGGMDPAKYPEAQKNTESNVHMLMACADGTYLLWEKGHVPMKFQDRFIAIGSGRDYAIAAMHCGKTAKEAVEIACMYDTDCGNGVDALELK